MTDKAQSVEHLRLVTYATISGIHEHSRTISGRKTPSGEAVLEHISLGWFLHFEELDFSICWGHTLPRNLAVGDRIRISFEKA